MLGISPGCGCRKLCRAWSGGISVVVDEPVASGGSGYGWAMFAPKGTTEFPAPTGQNGFTGDINWIQLDADDAADDVDHYIDPAERFRIILGRH